MGVITQHRASTALVERYVGTAYDNVKKVADDIENVNHLAEIMQEGLDFQTLAVVLQNLGDSVSDLAALAQADLVAISADLVKGNYLGNRKIDIDLALNNLSETQEVTYQGVTVTTNEGVVLQIDFTGTNSQGDTVTEELASYTAIYNAIIAGITEYNATEPNSQLHIVNTEIDIINSTLPHLPTMIRIRDMDGNASNIDRFQLQVYSGSAIDSNPAFYWAKTTSALQTLANRIGDVIALGNDIDSIIRLATQRDEIQHIFDNRMQLLGSSNSLYSELGKLVTVFNNLSGILAAEQHSLDAQSYAGNSNTAALASAHQVTLAAEQVQLAANQVTLAQAKVNEMKALTVASVLTGVAGSNAQVIYNSADNSFTFVIPQGNKGDKGDPFQVNAVGSLADRANFDAQAKGFSFLDLANGVIYFKNSNTSGDWSNGAPFGKGDKGDEGDPGVGIVNILFTSTTHASGNPGQPSSTDTYTINRDNGASSTFTVYNGNEFTVAQLIDDGAASPTSIWSSQKVAQELATKANSNAVATAAQGEKADSALQANAIGQTVQPFNQNTVIDAGYVPTEENFTTALKQKLNGLENPTAEEILTALKTVHGTGSGLDADKLGGQSADYYARRFTQTITSLPKVLQAFESCFVAEPVDVTLPPTPSSNTEVIVTLGDYTTPINVLRNGRKIMGWEENFLMDIPFVSIKFKFISNDYGWRIMV